MSRPGLRKESPGSGSAVAGRGQKGRPGLGQVRRRWEGLSPQVPCVPSP